MKKEIVDNMMKTNNENFTKLNTPINRVSTLVYFIYNNFVSNILPNLSILFVIFLYFIYNDFKFGTIFLFFNIIILIAGYFIITPSKILILDEPTNALDIELKKDLIEVIKYFKRYKKCIIIISHDSDIFPIFDKKIQV